ncbi:MAG: YIP1 family protein [Anaerolineae bacterium]|nr:YIP1 family protein [Anaerolineae bacterium]MCB0206333.1 YIP1 family protein [Anaerolineae bacterium]MCB0254427.1 YIP1 family protein [Anaerolineae bacterium]
MQPVTRSFGLLWDALFLQRDAYAHMRDDDNPFVEGLFILVLLGVLLAVAAIIGTTLEWASTPNLDAVRDVVLKNLQTMEWYQFLQQSPGGESSFLQVWNSIWNAFAGLAPSPLRSLTGIITRPLGLIVWWLVFGLLAHGLARVFGGKGTLNQTLGATALAASPQLITLLTVLPFVAVAGLGTWTLLCGYMALRTVHDLSWPRAVFAALLPPLIIGLVVALIVSAVLVVGFTIAMASFGGGM